MTSIDRIVAKNFRSFADVDIVFKAKDGIILMSGEIGSGKSTLINAICWCLYGDTPLYAIGDPKQISNLHAPKETPVKVELTVTIDDRQYVFSRQAIGSGIGGSLTVQYEQNGNWETVDGAATNDYVRRLLPKDIRHLFVFNGEQIMKIFDPSNHGNLKTSVLKVSEVDLINLAKEHLSLVSDDYFAEIKKLNRHAKEIETLRSAVSTYTKDIETKQIAIDKFEADIAIKKEKISALDKEIEATADARKLLDDKDRIENDLRKIEDDLFDYEQRRNENFTDNYVCALLDGEFEEYKNELEKADAEGLIPPPVKPEVTARIIRDKKCICGRDIGPAEEAFIKQQHEEYCKKEELHYLTDGINCYYRMHGVIKESYYNIQDCIDKLDEIESDKKKLSRELRIVNDALDGKQKPDGDNPEARRNDLRDEIELYAKAKGREENAKEELVRKLSEAKESLKNAISQDDTTDLLQKKMDYSDRLISLLGDIASTMEEQIREKLKENTEDIFFSILSGGSDDEVKFSEIEIDKNYIVSLLTDDNVIYATENLSTGQAKSLGLSLVYSLSKDLGYSETPLLIDNLYGDISERQYEELTKMIRHLSNDKQIIITDLMSSAARKLLGSDVVKQAFVIKGESKQSVITEEVL